MHGPWFAAGGIQPKGAVEPTDLEHQVTIFIVTPRPLSRVKRYSIKTPASITIRSVKYANQLAPAPQKMTEHGDCSITSMQHPRLIKCRSH